MPDDRVSWPNELHRLGTSVTHNTQADCLSEKPNNVDVYLGASKKCQETDHKSQKCPG